MKLYGYADAAELVGIHILVTWKIILTTKHMNYDFFFLRDLSHTCTVSWPMAGGHKAAQRRLEQIQVRDAVMENHHRDLSDSSTCQ